MYVMVMLYLPAEMLIGTKDKQFKSKPDSSQKVVNARDFRTNHTNDLKQLWPLIEIPPRSPPKDRRNPPYVLPFEIFSARNRETERYPSFERTRAQVSPSPPHSDRLVSLVDISVVIQCPKSSDLPVSQFRVRILNDKSVLLNLFKTA